MMSLKFLASKLNNHPIKRWWQKTSTFNYFSHFLFIVGKNKFFVAIFLKHKFYFEINFFCWGVQYEFQLMIEWLIDLFGFWFDSLRRLLLIYFLRIENVSLFGHSLHHLFSFDAVHNQRLEFSSRQRLRRVIYLAISAKRVIAVPFFYLKLFEY